MLPEFVQHFPEVISMVLWVGRIYQDVVKENQDEFVQVLTEEIVHHVHELGRGIGNTEWHDLKFIELPPCLKCCFVNVS